MVQEVRKITIALKNEFCFYVNQTLHNPNIIITKITIESPESNIFGTMVHKIYAKTPNSLTEFVWKEIQGIPVMVEYFV